MRLLLKQLLTRLIIFGTVGVSGTVGALTIQSTTGNLDITNPAKRYECSFYNYDDTLLYITQVEPSHDAVYRGNLPVKPATDEYTYVFTGWDTPLAQIMKNTEFHAVYEMKRRDFTVQFVNYDGTVLYQTMVQAGDSVRYPYENPTRPGDEQYGYVFKGWDEDTSKITKDTSFVAQYEKTKKQYKVYYFNYDEKLLYTDQVYYGESSTYKGPSFSGPEASAGYVYKFQKWSDSTSMITADKAVIALFELERKQFAVTFYNYDQTVLYVDEVFYGDTAVYRGPTPYRPSDDDYSYVFAGWDKQFETITEDTAVYALYHETNPDCRITFKNYNDEILDVQEVKYGSNVEYRGEEPTRPETDKYIYVFAGWDRDTSSVHASFDVYPIFEEYLKEYTITFLNYDESELAKVNVPYGANGYNAYDVIPIRPDDDFYTYEFEQWSDDISCITGDITVVAIYKATPKEQNKGESEEGQGGDQGDHGHPEGDPPPPGGGPAEKFQVTYLNYDSEELDFDGVLAGRPSQYDRNKPLPTRPDNKQHTNYEFCSWSQDLSSIQDNITVYAQYVIKEDIFTKYIVTFRNIDGSLLYECVCEENDMPYFPENLTPHYKKGFIFVGWDRALVRASSSYTLFAKFVPASYGNGGSGIGEGGGEGEGEGQGEGGGQGEGAGDVSGSVTGDFSWTDNIVSNPIGTLKTTYDKVIYLRERSFGNFVNNNWESAFQYSSKSASFSPMNLSSDLITQTDLRSFTAEMTFDNYRYYTPSPMYNTSFPLSENDDCYATIPEKSFSFDYVPFELTSETYKKLSAKSYAREENIANASDYEDYVYKTYLTLNDEEKEFFTNFAIENDLSVSNIVEILNVKTFISEYAEYNLHSATYPSDQNYAIYFLKEAKEGICNNFATALTLLYRALGLPARFTVGYIVKPAAEGNIRTVDTQYAHAWTEIYLDNIGWVYVDGTGGSNNADGNEGFIPPTGNKYNPFGKLTLNEPVLTIKYEPISSSKVYDGEPMEINTSYEGEFLEDGDHIEYNVINEETNVGTYVTRAAPRIYDKNDKDVTKKYAGMVQINYQSYSITKRVIEITTGSMDVARGGDTLTCTDYTVTGGSFASGQVLVVSNSTSISGPGTAANVFISYKIINEEDVDKEEIYYSYLNNYQIVWVYGTLTVH